MKYASSLFYCMNIFSELTAICIGSFIGNSTSGYFSNKNKKSFNKPFQLRLDLTDCDKDIFYAIQDAVKNHKKIEISLVGGSCRCNPDYAINWYYALMSRPNDCHVSVRLFCNARESAMCIVVACDEIIPRYGSWYEIASIDHIEGEMEEFGFGSGTRQKASFTNLKLVHRILGQYLEISKVLDKQIPLASMKDDGLPVVEPTREQYRTPIDVG